MHVEHVLKNQESPPMIKIPPRIVVHKKPQTIDEVCKKNRGGVHLFGFHFINFYKLNKVDKNKVEETLIEMMENFKYTPLELGNMIPNERYKRIDEKWKFSLMRERKIREGTLA